MNAPVGAPVTGRDLRIALVGNPNSGKTALFNALTGGRAKVANYAGVTVERKEGFLTTPAGRRVSVLDLPGTYSLRARSPDEEVTRDVVLGEGHLNATLDGNTLKISGNFSGLSSAATTAKLGIGLDFGVPATEFFATLTPSSATDGSVSGTVTLTSAQVTALNKRQLFLQLNSVKGTDGSLWGWFEPAKAVSAKGKK